jgi:MerR family transcriptional regulator, global nitrogen regulator
MTKIQQYVINLFMAKLIKPEWVLDDLEFLSKLIVGIGEVSEITGIPQRQLRYWEQKGIIKTTESSAESSTRRFDYMEIKKILLLKELLDEGYTLEAAHRKLTERCERLNATFKKFKK